MQAFSDHTLSLFSSSSSDDGSRSPRSRPIFPTTVSNQMGSFHEASTCSSDSVTSKEDKNGDVSVGDLLDALYCFRGPKRIRLPRRPVPRLLHSDPRRYYATMLMNVINSHNTSYMQSFVERYMTPQTTLKRPAMNMEVTAKTSILLDGRDAILRYWSFLCAILPDQIMKTDNIRVVRSSNSETSKVVCDLVSSWTQICDQQFVFRCISSAMMATPGMETKEISDGYEYRCLGKMYSIDSNKKKRCFSDLIETNGARLTLPDAPTTLRDPAANFGRIKSVTTMAMTLTLHIDELRQISALEFGAASAV